MSTLKRQDCIDEGCRRLVCESVEAAIRELTRKDGSAKAAAGAMRWAEAGVALIAPNLPREALRRDHRLLERVAVEIDAALRPDELLSRLDQAAKPCDAVMDDAPAKAFRKALARRLGAGLSMNAPDRSFDPVVYRLVADLAELRGHVGQWPAMEMDPARPPAGLRRAYVAARRAAQLPPTASADQAERAAGDLQALGLQLFFLNRCCPDLLKPQRKLVLASARAMSQYAAGLRLADLLDTDEHRAWAQPVLKSLREQDAARQAAKLRGTALAETPGAFINRITAYWRYWRKF